LNARLTALEVALAVKEERIAAVEATNAKLQDRVLELEAALAVALPPQ
jgi:hypothetical protein